MLTVTPAQVSAPVVMFLGPVAGALTCFNILYLWFITGLRLLLDNTNNDDSADTLVKHFFFRRSSEQRFLFEMQRQWSPTVACAN